ncbi:MAG: hypothetical protein LBN94_00510 [Puniceicoccales bacterium]|jgi:hypothetical protein|nr:hypothetical protein [Puniceicoccales bacterium]
MKSMQKYLLCLIGIALYSGDMLAEETIPNPNTTVAPIPCCTTPDNPEDDFWVPEYDDGAEFPIFQENQEKES